METKTLLLVASAGAGLAAIAYGIYRRVGLAGSPLIVYASTGSGAGEFQAVASRLAQALPGSRKTATPDGLPGLRTAIQAHQGRIGPLILVGHGTTRAFFSNLSPVAPTALAGLLHNKLAADAVVSLAGCRAGADTSEVDWSAASYGAGGASSFAGLLRDALVADGAPWGTEIRAHSTTGTTTLNPAVRVFRATRSQVGQPGLSALEILWGEGAAGNAGLRSRWTEAFRGAAAEQYMAGGELRVA